MRQKIEFYTIVIMTLGLILSACVSAPQQGTAEKPIPSSTTSEEKQVLAEAKSPASETPVIEGPTEIPEPTSTNAVESPSTQDADCSPIPLDQSILIMDWDESQDINLLHPVNPKDGQVLCGFASIELGDAFQYAFSDDYSHLAVATFRNGFAKSAKLELVDLKTWQSVAFPLEIKKWISRVTFNHAGDQVALAFNSSSTYSTKPQSFTLLTINLLNGQIEASREIEFNPRWLNYTPDDVSLIVFGGREGLTDEEMPQGHALLLNAQDLSTAWEPQLDGILVGSSPPETEDSDPIFEIYEPAVTLSPDGMRLYIVHSDAETLTTIDFTSHSLDTVDIAPKLSFVERLLALTARVAHAKGANGTTKRAVLSADGNQLYVVSWTNTAEKDSQGNWNFGETPHGLQVVNVESGEQITRLATSASEVLLSSDGNQLLLQGWEGEVPWTDVIAIEDMQLIKHVFGHHLQPALTLSGEQVLLANSAYRNGIRTGLVDPADLATSDELELKDWKHDGYILTMQP